MKYQMHCESDLNSLSHPLKLLSFSDAYLDSASRLCIVLKRSPRKSNYSRGAVVMQLMVHAIELFLKGTILEKDPHAQIGHHDIQALSKQYKNLYKEKKYTFHAPFTWDELGLNEIYGPEKVQNVKRFIKESKRRNPLGQHHRYPGNLEGQPWDSIIGFEPGSCLVEIKALKADIARLTNLIFPANTV